MNYQYKPTHQVSDFGLSRSLYASVEDLASVSSGLPVRWMAPEVLKTRMVNNKSDVWSFGVLLWEILNFAGIRPYQDLSDSSLLAALHSKSPPALPAPRNCHRDLYDLMLECWNISETLRPSFREIHLFLQRKNLGYSPT